MPNQNGLKNHICVLVCLLIPCNKLEGIFKHIGLKAWAHMHGVAWHFNSKKLKNDQKNMKPCLM